MTAFVGTYGHWARYVLQCIIRACGQRLFHQFHTKPHKMRCQISVNLCGPPLVGIYDNARARRAGPDSFQPWHILGCAQLDLQKRPMGMFSRLRAHLLRRI